MNVKDRQNIFKYVYLALGLYRVGGRYLGGGLGKPSFEGGGGEGVAPDNMEECVMRENFDSKPTSTEC